MIIFFLAGMKWYYILLIIIVFLIIFAIMICVLKFIWEYACSLLHLFTCGCLGTEYYKICQSDSTE